MSLSRSAVRWSAWCLAALGAEACLSGTDLVSPPRVPPTTITLEFRADSEDLATATALGWVNGIPGVQVTLTAEDSTSGGPRELQGSDSGTLLLDQLAGGRYTLDAVRWLTDSERAQLPGGDDAIGFVARVPLITASVGARLPVRLVASRRRGLVISEWAFNIAALQPVNETYAFGGFLELYNDADTTAYLDGLTIAQGIVYGYDYPNFPCTATAALTTDPQGIWTRYVQQFPGRGRDYPVLPGGIVVLAIDAIDHSKIVSAGLDLSHADFEFWGGSGDVDNPAVPNMIDTLSLGINVLGHGPLFQNLASVAVLGRPYDLATVARQQDPTGTEYARIPANSIMDVVTLWPNYVAEWPRCQSLISPRFDRSSFDGRGYDENVEYYYSVSRRSIPMPAANQKLLQVSRSSSADFTRTLRSPGIAP